MKKILALILVLILAFSMTACAAQVPIYTASWGKLGVYEKSTYTVTVNASETALDSKAPRLSGEGTYDYIVESVEGKDSAFKITTNFAFNGEYTLADGTKVPVADSVTSVAEFYDVDKDFKPITSEKEYKGKTVVYDDGNYSVEDMHYQSKVTYGEKKATVQTLKADANGNFTETIGNLGESFELTLGAMSMDNEQAILFLRGWEKAVNTSTSFYLVSGMSNTTLPMIASTGANLIEEQTNINGESKKLNCFGVKLSKNGTDKTGSSLYLSYIADDKGDVNNESGGLMNTNRTRLVKMQQIIPYTGDVLSYELTGYEYGKAE